MDSENQQLVKRVAQAMKCGHYPSAKDAKVIDDQLHKARLTKRRKKLEVHFVAVIFTHSLLYSI